MLPLACFFLSVRAALRDFFLIYIYSSHNNFYCLLLYTWDVYAVCGILQDLLYLSIHAGFALFISIFHWYIFSFLMNQFFIVFFYCFTFIFFCKYAHILGSFTMDAWFFLYASFVNILINIFVPHHYIFLDIHACFGCAIYISDMLLNCCHSSYFGHMTIAVGLYCVNMGPDVYLFSILFCT